MEPTDKAFAQGSDAKVECKADGFPRPQVTWKRAEGMRIYKNIFFFFFMANLNTYLRILRVSGNSPGNYIDLKPNNPNIIVEDGTLSVLNIQKSNEGYYMCEAVNGIGSGLSAVIYITVQGNPNLSFQGSSIQLARDKIKISRIFSSSAFRN